MIGFSYCRFSAPFFTDVSHKHAPAIFFLFFFCIPICYNGRRVDAYTFMHFDWKAN
jgi:hypothetical protein